MKSLSFGIRFFVAALFLGLAGALLVLAFQVYQRESIVDLTPPAKKSDDPKVLMAEELKQTITQPRVQSLRYRVIEDRNLFTPQREAWAPPEPEPEPEPSPEESQDSEESAVKRTDVRLYGTFQMKNKRYAILGLPLLGISYPRFTAAEGQTFTNENTEDELSYTLLSVRDDHVLMKDNSGKKFKIFFDQSQKGNRGSTIAASASQVVVTSQATPSKASKKTSANGKAEGKASSGGTVTKQEGPQIDPGLIPREKRLQMIRDGSLLKVQTPFGYIYKYPE